MLEIYLQCAKSKQQNKSAVFWEKSSFLFASFSLVLNLLVDYPTQRTIWEQKQAFLERFILPTAVQPPATEPCWQSDVEQRKTWTLIFPNNKTRCIQQIRQIYTPFTHSDSGQWQDRVSLLASKWPCTPWQMGPPPQKWTVWFTPSLMCYTLSNWTSSTQKADQ